VFFIKKIPDYDITFICAKDHEHFAEPILDRLGKKYKIQHLLMVHKRDYWHFKVKGRVIWCEWANKFAHQVSQRKWQDRRVIVRLHRYEIDSVFMKLINWENIDNAIFVNSNFENKFKQKVSPDVKTITIPNAIDIDSFPYRSHQYGKSLCAYGLGFDKRKGYNLLINMFKKLHDIDPEFRLTILGMTINQAGSLNNLATIKKQIIDLGLSEKVTIIERDKVSSLVEDRKNISEIIMKHDIIMSYSENESFHYSLAEGLLSGLEGFYNMWQNPLISEFWANWGYQSEDDLINGIVNWSKLSQDEKENRALTNRNYVSMNFGSKVISKKFEKLFFNDGIANGAS